MVPKNMYANLVRPSLQDNARILLPAKLFSITTKNAHTNNCSRKVLCKMTTLDKFDFAGLLAQINEGEKTCSH
jgi:hypothetical protein